MEDNQENKENKEILEQEQMTKNQEEKVEQEVTEIKEETLQNEETKELIEVKKKKNVKKGSCLLATIGAILGGAVATIPWILVYALADALVIPLLAIIIPIGAYLGYRIFKGNITKKSRAIITIVSLLLIALVTTVICPGILVIKSAYELNLENILGLYTESREKIRNEIIKDLIAGLLFTIVGIIITIKVFINKKKVAEENSLLHQEAKKQLKEQSDIIKRASIDLNSMSKENAVKKKQILEQLKIVYNIKGQKSKLYFKNSLSNKLLRKYKGKYYYDETDEATKIEKAKKIKKAYISPMKVISKMLIILAIAAGIAFYRETIYTVTDTNIKLRINPFTQDLYGTHEEISEGIGVGAAEYYAFIIEEKNEKYEISGQLISKSLYEKNEAYDIDTIIKQDRDYFATLVEENEISEVQDKEFGGKNFKHYYYNYISNNDKECRSQVYLYEAEEKYLWIEARSLRSVDMAEINKVIENLFK